MINITDKKNCYGCGACKQICPAACITMAYDEQGFLYPRVDMDRCISCEKCVSACIASKDNIAEHAGEDRISPPIASIAKNKNEEDFKISSSGGMFIAFSDYTLQKGGICYGAAFDKDVYLRTTSAENREELFPIIGSKYTQCDTQNAYAEIEAHLKDGRQVLYCATPCQVAGLYGYLGKDYDNLLTLDLVCQGVPSPEAFRKYLDYLEKQFNDKIVGYRFRDNTVCTRACQNLVYFESLGVKAGPTYECPYRRIFIPNVSLRPSCYACGYAGRERISDITIADFKRIDKLDRKLSVNDRYSTVIMNTKKGKDLFEAVKSNMITIDITMDSMMSFHPRLNEPAKEQPQTKDYWEDYYTKPFDYILAKYTTSMYFDDDELLELAINRNILHLAAHGYISPVTEEKLLALWDNICLWILIPMDEQFEEAEEFNARVEDVRQRGLKYLLSKVPKMLEIDQKNSRGND